METGQNTAFALQHSERGLESWAGGYGRDRCLRWQVYLLGKQVIGGFWQRGVKELVVLYHERYMVGCKAKEEPDEEDAVIF